MVILFDEYCNLCRRTSVIITKLDWLSLIEIKPLRKYLEKGNTIGIDRELAVHQMPSFTDKWQYGYNSIYEIVKRLPMFWLLLPMFFVLKKIKLGQLLYVKLSVNRKIIPIHCTKEECYL